MSTLIHSYLQSSSIPVWSLLPLLLIAYISCLRLYYLSQWISLTIQSCILSICRHIQFIFYRTAKCFYCTNTHFLSASETRHCFECLTCGSKNAFDQNGEFIGLPEHYDASLNPNLTVLKPLNHHSQSQSFASGILCDYCTRSQQIRTHIYLTREETEMHETLPFEELCCKCHTAVHNYWRYHFDWFISAMQAIPGVFPSSELSSAFLSISFIPFIYACLPGLRYFGHASLLYTSFTDLVPCGSIINETLFNGVVISLSVWVQLYAHNPLYVAYYHHQTIFRRAHYAAFDHILSEYRDKCICPRVLTELVQLLFTVFGYNMCNPTVFCALSAMSVAVSLKVYKSTGSSASRILQRYNEHSQVLPPDLLIYRQMQMGIYDSDSEVDPQQLQDQSPSTPAHEEDARPSTLTPEGLIDRFSSWDTGIKITPSSIHTKPGFNKTPLPPIDPNIPLRPQGFGHNNAFRASLATNLEHVNPYTIPKSMYIRPSFLDAKAHIDPLPHTFAPNPSRPTSFDPILVQQAQLQLQRRNDRHALTQHQAAVQQRAAFNPSGPPQYHRQPYIASDLEDEEGPTFFNPFGQARPLLMQESSASRLSGDWKCLGSDPSVMDLSQ